MSDFKLVNFISNLSTTKNPFPVENFKLNLFNFDPIIYYISGGGTIIHPLFSFLTLTIGKLAVTIGGNFSILIINSLFNALSVTLLYIFSVKNSVERKFAFIIAAIYAVISYRFITSFIPDSYVYAEFFIILSLVYITYMKKEEVYNVFVVAILAIFNFGITITNIVPFALGILINKPKFSVKKLIKKIFLSIFIFFILLSILTVIQHLIYGRNWLTGWQNYLQAGGTAYSETFNFSKHSKILRLLIASPIILPVVTLIDPGIMAVVTDLNINLNIFEILFFIVFTIFLIVAILKNLKNSVFYILLTFIIWNVFIHFIKGFGLVTFNYDMYLYAGHYIAILFMIISLAFKNDSSNKIFKKSAKLSILEKFPIKSSAFYVLVIGFIFLLLTNLFRLNDLLNFLQSIY
ncbi:MAG: DUF6080 domain-containing protein [Sarcina sp.]